MTSYTDTSVFTEAEKDEALELMDRLMAAYNAFDRHRDGSLHGTAPFHRIGYNSGWAGDSVCGINLSLGSVILGFSSQGAGERGKYVIGSHGRDSFFVHTREPIMRRSGLLLRKVETGMYRAENMVGLWSDRPHMDNERLAGPWWAHIREQLAVVRAELAQYEESVSQRTATAAA